MPHKERLYNIKEKVKKWKSFLIAFCVKISGTGECLMHDVADNYSPKTETKHNLLNR